MKGLGVVALVLALGVTTPARAQSLTELGAAMGTQSAAAGVAAPNFNGAKARAQNAATQSATPNPIGILADYGNRVASEAAAKQGSKSTWASGGGPGGKAPSSGKTWASEGGGSASRSAGASTWAKNDKEVRPVTRRR